MPFSVPRSNPPHTTAFSSAVYGTHHRRAGAAPGSRRSPLRGNAAHDLAATDTCTAAHPRRRPLLRRHRHARPCTPPPAPTRPLAHAPTRLPQPAGTQTITRAQCCCAHDAANANATARARAHSRLVRRIIAQERCCCTHKNGPLRATARTRRLFPYALPHTPLLPPVVASQHAHSAFFFFGVSTLFSADRFPFVLTAPCAASAYQHARTRSA